MSIEFRYPDSDYLHRLGKVTISFSDLEWTLGLLLEVVVDPFSKTGTILAAHLSFARMIDVLMATYSCKWPACSRYSDLAQLLQQAQAIEQERNSIVHSSYGFPEGPGELLVRMKSSATRKHGLRHTRKEISIKEMDAFLESIVAVVSSVQEFVFWVMKTKYQLLSDDSSVEPHITPPKDPVGVAESGNGG